ncbi:MAG: ribbon-helix-helix domain-containing protein [Cyanobacteria bacterium J06638_28]
MKKKRLNLELSDEAYEQLEKLAEASGKNKAEILRTGLALYGLLEEEKEKGRNLGIIDDEQVVTKIFIP